MADREKVLIGLEHCSEDGCKGCPYEPDCKMCDGFSLLAKDALELLKEQEPVRPKKWIPKGQILARVRGYYCPVCDTSISLGDRFCHRCGRAMKWDE